MAGSSQTYPSSEILDDTTNGGSALPTIADLDPLVSSKAEWILKKWRSLFFIPNGKFITDVKGYHHLQPLLADSTSTASDVYLVSRPPCVGNNPIGSLQHWSFYTQGIFYHLSAPDQPRDTTRKSEYATKSREAVCQLKREDLSDISSEDYIRQQSSPSRILLVAYKVGQTDYRSEQILQLAEWAIRQFSTYGLFSANCQHFATTMVRNTVMRVGDRSAFAGTAVQIVDWDLTRGSQPHVNSIDHGFLIAPPLPADESMFGGFVSSCCFLFKLRGYRRPGPIRILYEKGPRALGACHPAGYRTMDFESIRELCILVYRACAEFKEDLSQKRWKDAIYGRYEELPDGTMKRRWKDALYPRYDKLKDSTSNGPTSYEIQST